MFILNIFLLFLMPPSPQLLERLSVEEKNEIRKILIDARKKGVDQPDFNNLEKFRVRLMIKQNDTMNIPVILVEFSDNPADSPVTHFQDMLFSVNTYPTGSLTDYYLENSYGNFFVDGWISDWLLMPNSYSYYTDGQYGFGSYPRNAQGLARDAVLAADPYIDFSQFDRDNDGYVDVIFIIHAGPGGEETGDPDDIWSHAWYIPGGVNVDGVTVYRYSMEPENGRMGVFAHEFGHNLGLPDLYDTDYSSEGLGNWSVMAGGSWGNNGRTPVHFDVWCKYKLGFLNPVNVTSIINNAPFPPVELYPVAYRLWTNGNASSQYFLVEFRDKTRGFDATLPSSGLLIFHIDETQQNNRNEWYPGHTGSGHYKVALEQADGRWDLEKNINSGDKGDPYPGNTYSRSFNDYSIPDSRDYTFSTTYVSVTGISDYQDTMYADLAVVPVHNISVDSSNFPVVIEKDSSITPVIYLSNAGFYTDNFDLYLRIDSMGSPVYVDQINNITLNPNEVNFFSLSPFTAKFSNGMYKVYAYISSPNEEMFRNDTLKLDLFSYELLKFINVPYTTSEPVIDGIIDSVEWSDAFVYDISDYLKKAGLRNIQEAFGYIKNSDSILYFGITVKDTETGNYIIKMRFDDNADGQFPDSSDTSEGELKLQQSGQSLTVTFTPYFSNGQSGQSHPVSFPYAFSLVGDERHFELAIPFAKENYALDEEISIRHSTDTFAFFIIGRNSARPDFNIYWVQDVPFSQTRKPYLYSKLEVTNLNVGVKERNSLSRSFSFNINYTEQGLKIMVLQNDKEPVSIKLIDPTGRIKSELNSKALEIISFIPYKKYKKGVYFILIKRNNYRWIKKVIMY